MFVQDIQIKPETPKSWIPLCLSLHSYLNMYYKLITYYMFNNNYNIDIWKLLYNSSNHADADRDETIDYKDMPTNVQEQYNLKNHPVNIITMNNMKLFYDELTKDKHGATQKLHTVEYPTLGTGNTAKYDGQTYLIMNDGTLYDLLDY